MAKAVNDFVVDPRMNGVCPGHGMSGRIGHPKTPDVDDPLALYNAHGDARQSQGAHVCLNVSIDHRKISARCIRTCKNARYGRVAHEHGNGEPKDAQAERPEV